MPLSMYQASAPVFLRGLQNLSAILKKAQAEVDGGRIGEAELIEGRLASDMLPLPRQVQIAADTAKGCMARLAGATAPAYEDTEATLAELQDRLAKTIAYLNTVPAEAIDGSEERTITMKLPDRELHMPGQFHLLGFALPNFFFHVTTGYDILRHKGVPVGKMDYLGGV